MTKNLCEIRVVSYCRPEWLHECLNSLILQDHHDWVAIVFDDTPDDSCQTIVSELMDGRIQYRKNEPRAGCAKNLNQAFRATPYLDGEYACVLEDDSWFYPDCLSSNIRSLAQTNTRVMLRNADIWDRNFVPPVKISESTLEKLSESIMSPAALHATLFFAGCYNPSWFWRTDCDANFTITKYTDDACQQEFLRVTDIAIPVYFASQPKIAWGYAPSRQLAMNSNSIVERRRVNFWRQSVMRSLLKSDGEELLKHAAETARKYGLERHHLLECADALILQSNLLTWQNACSTVLQFLKAGVKRLIF